MANRVVLGSFDGTYVLRVSRPSFDVLSSLSVEELAFDSRWLETGKEFMSGTFSADMSNSSTTINFGVTLSAPPLIILRIVGSGNRFWIFTGQVDWTLAGTPELEVTKSSFLFTVTSSNSSSPNGSYFSGTRTVHYTVYENMY